MYLSSLPEAVAGSEAGERTGFLNGGSNAGDKALLEMGLQQDMVHPNDSGFRRNFVIGIACNEDNWPGDVAAAQSACKIPSMLGIL